MTGKAYVDKSCESAGGLMAISGGHRWSDRENCWADFLMIPPPLRRQIQIGVDVGKGIAGIWVTGVCRTVDVQHYNSEKENTCT